MIMVKYLKRIIDDDLDNPIQDQKDYNGILLENFVASLLFSLKNIVFYLKFYAKNLSNQFA